MEDGFRERREGCRERTANPDAESSGQWLRLGIPQLLTLHSGWLASRATRASITEKCAGRDLNPHGISTTSPSNSRVCHSTTRANSGLQSRGSAVRLKQKYYYLGGAGSNGLLAGANA